MALEIHRKEKESSSNLVRRFVKRIRQSGILRQAKEARFRKEKISHLTKKRSALRREELKKRYQELEKFRKE